MRTNSQKKRTQIFRKLKNKIKRRLKKKQYQDQPMPIMTAQNIHYEIGEKTRAMSYGGLGAIHDMVKRIGLDKEMGAALLKRRPTAGKQGLSEAVAGNH